MAEISLSLDTYDDIFSDFDPRPFNHRSVSEDFLAEIKRASRDKATGEIEISFMIPKKMRNKTSEILIKKRLREHFKRHAGLMHKEKNKLLLEGGVFIGIGMILMVTVAVMFFEKINKDLFSRLIFTMLEPAGWFLFWEGLELIIFESRKKRSDILFYDKMSKADIRFLEH